MRRLSNRCAWVLFTAAVAAPASATTLVENQDFGFYWSSDISQKDPSATFLGNPTISQIAQIKKTDTFAQSLTAPAFDPTLGRLDSIMLFVHSSFQYIVGVSYAYAPGGMANSHISAMNVNTIKVNSTTLSEYGMVADVGCSTSAASPQACANFSVKTPEDLELTSVAPTSTPIQLDFASDLSSDVSFFAYPSFAMAPDQKFSAASSIYWSGTISVAYTYSALPSPAAVPETATWATLLLGFGMIGGARRRQRAAGLRRTAASA